MNRHLHNTLSALAASGSILVLGLIAAAPLMPRDASLAPQTLVTTTRLPAGPGSTALEPESAAAVVSVVMLASAIEQATTIDIDTAPKRTTRNSQRERRQTLVMPYLSFVPRG
jgi:hypothetical protein